MSHNPANVQSVADIAALKKLWPGQNTQMVTAWVQSGGSPAVFNKTASLYTWNSSSAATANDVTYVTPTGNAGNGRWVLNMPSSVGFSAQSGADQTGVATATWTRVTMSTIGRNVGGGFNGQTFTAPIDGNYRFTGTVEASGTAISRIGIGYYVNGSQTAVAVNDGTTSGSVLGSISRTMVLYLLATETLEMYGLATVGSGNVTLLGSSSTFCTLSGEWVSA